MCLLLKSTLTHVNNLEIYTKIPLDHMFSHRVRSQFHKHIPACGCHAEQVAQRLSVNKCLECVSLASAEGKPAPCQAFKPLTEKLGMRRKKRRRKRRCTKTPNVDMKPKCPERMCYLSGIKFLCSKDFGILL